MKTTTELLLLNATVGNKLDTAAPDHAAMRFLLQARRAVRAELEARHNAAAAEPLRFTEVERGIARELNAAPFLFVGHDADGMACYED
jgi:hypothetical protein